MKFDRFIEHLKERNIDVLSGADAARCDCLACGANRGLSISKGQQGQALIYDHGGCKLEEILAKLDIDPAEFSNAAGCTLEQFAAKIGIPASFLKQRGLADGFFKRGGEKIPAVVIPYLNENAEHAATRYRIRADGQDKHRWQKGTKARGLLYGAENLPGLDPEFNILVEGESCTLTLNYNGFPGVGLPGASMFDPKSLSDRLGKFKIIYIVIEGAGRPDHGGEEILKRLASAPAEFRNKVRLLFLGEHKDVNDLFKADPENFVRNLNGYMAAAPTFEEYQKQRQEEARAAKAVLASKLIACQDILAEFAKEKRLAGLAGEDRNAKLIYLAVTSRLTASPVNIVLQGLSAAGKSYTVKTVLKFFPPFACVEFTSMSEKALVYFQDPLCHRMIFIAEAPGLDAEFLNYVVRTLLSEKQIIYYTVEKDTEGQLKTVVKIVPGPTGMITTTTRFALHPENSTRCLFLPADDSPEQTARILAECFEVSERRCEVDFERWHALQDWLAGAVLEATIPFRKAIYQNIPPAAVRLRRDAGVLQILIQTHAILHQKSRQIDARGRVVATLADYAAVYDLVADLMAEQAATGASSSDLEFFEMVKDAAAKDEDGEAYVTTGLMVKITKKGQPWTLRRLGKLAKAGYLQKDAKRREHRYYMPDDLPGGAVPILPAPELVAAWIAANSDEPDPALDTPALRDPGDEPETEPVPVDGAVFN